MEHRLEPFPALALHQLLFRIRRKVDATLRHRFLRSDAAPLLEDPVTPLQGEIMGDLKQPPVQIRSVATEAEMSEQRKKRVLDNVLGFLSTESERCDVAQQLRRTAIEQREHVRLDRIRSRRYLFNSYERSVDDRV